MVIDNNMGPLGFPRSNTIPGQIGTVGPQAPLDGTTGNDTGPNFADLLDNKVKPKATTIDPLKASGLESAFAKPETKIKASESVKFSNHALERMTSRGVSIKPEDLIKLNDAVERAAQKGSRESLVLMGENALIVSVKNRTVVTAMDREAMRENIFTNIDSTVIL